MSSESFAAFRRHAGNELASLAEEHFKHDLNDGDRQKLQSAGKSFGTWSAVGSFVGLGLGALLAFRLRTGRRKMYQAFRTADKPTHLKFADGREEPLPDITAAMQPSTLGDIATYTFCSLGCLFVGGELGMLGGSISAKRAISSDPESRERIEKAFRSFRADVLRREANSLEKGEKGMDF